MEIDAKQKVLMAIYAEYQKDIPNMANVTFESLDMDCQVFRIAVDKLENERLVYPDLAVTDFIKMTCEGIDFVETKMDIGCALSGKEKLELFRQKCGKLGWQALSDFTARAIIEASKQMIT